MKIFIVGGGSAGWMSAATLIHEFPNYDITVIESPNIATIGVGESTIGGIKQWAHLLEINEKQFLKHTDGSYKLSIKFTDFGFKGNSFHYPFGLPYLSKNKAHLNDWWFKKILYPETPNSDYAECIYPQMAIVNQNKMFYNENNEIPFNSYKDTAFHFDATKFGIWLKENYCKPRGVKHILENINTVEQDQNGIVSLNNKHTADLFVDCTGFKALLIDKTLKEPFDSYSDLLPNNSAWATRIPYADKEKELVGYTNCTAIENGWVWNIPLWSRIGSGYVYSDKFISDEDALIQFKKYLMKIEPIKLVPCDHLEFKNIKMRVGLHRRLWVKNVVAIGLSAGFIEPLESNGLFTTHEFLLNLVRQLNRGIPTQWDKDNFTNSCKITFRSFAEFVAMHYAFSKRNDTEYWKHNFNKTWDENLISLNVNQVNTMVIAAGQRARSFCYDTSSGMHCIAAGMNYAPTDLSSLISITLKSKEYYEKEFKECINNLNLRKKEWNEIVKNKPSLYQFLKDNIYN